ncbi:Rhodanese-like domain-containing protein [Dactylonectria macrodidyma]|uniref:Rhodanese-like domain-containing protein n=1 Tax=Dactylonectria macrodidyma TaxID=307937 RepID=A0A9P9JMW0_9HYPO|nr:Rhodanese-like domain-containing protein [Dactylonectria macrodidyma]
MASTQEHGNTPPWYAAYPAPRHTQPGSLTREELLEMMKAGKSVAGRDFVLVDLRRNDHEGGTIRGSINLPAQSLYPTIPTLYNMSKAAGLRKIIWYCSSSRGRGTRAAGWFCDYIADRGDGEMESLVLLEGIKGWATTGGEFVEWMDEYDAAAWIGK